MDAKEERTSRTLLALDARKEALQRQSGGWPSWTLAGGALADLEALLTGFFWPVRGYCRSCRLMPETGQSGHAPGRDAAIALEVSTEFAAKAAPGSHVALRDEEGVLLAGLEVEERWEEAGIWHLSGPLEGVELPVHDDFANLRLPPDVVVSRVRAQGRSQVLAFFPGDVLHAATRAALVAVADRLNAAILVLVGTRADEHEELSDFARVHAVLVSAELLPRDRTLVVVVPMSRVTDPLHAALRATLVARNCGASSRAVELGEITASETVAVRASAQALGLIVVPFHAWAYCGDRQALVDPDTAGDTTLAEPPPVPDLLSWKSNELPGWLISPQERDALRRAHAPRRAQGFTIFMTGLSGSGKSTIARALRAMLMEITGRHVTLLDGDRVRRHLSSELGFSREHRDLNIRRIGWLASEITRHGGVAICAPIAPYAAIRRQVRRMVEASGGFLLVYLSTPLKTCEERDRKGLYAMARAGSLPQFTGVSDPYEPPDDAALTIDTRDTSVQDACQAIIRSLITAGYLEPGR